jgi:vacuolar-type H+-ATPase subunit H
VLAGVRTTWGLRLAGAGACLALAAAACADDETRAERCDQLVDLGTSIDELTDDAGQDAEETIDDLRDDLESLETEVDEAVASDEELSEEARDRLESTVEDFRDAVDELGDDETADEVREQVDQAQQELSQRWDAALVALGCDEAES